MRRVLRKPAFCICENKDADQLRGNREADQRLCFRYTDSSIPLLPKYEISSLLPSSVAVQPGLCQTWWETPKTGFLTTITDRDMSSSSYTDIPLISPQQQRSKSFFINLSTYNHVPSNDLFYINIQVYSGTGVGNQSLILYQLLYLHAMHGVNMSEFVFSSLKKDRKEGKKSD